MSPVIPYREFEERLKYGHNFEDHVQEYMQSQGLRCYKYGLDTFPKSAKRKLVGLTDPTSLLLRFGPDFYCPIPGSFSFFIECKSRKSSSPYFSYNLESYNAAKVLAKLGINILIVFSGFKAQWIQDLPISKVCTDQASLNRSNGSSKPFVLIPQSELPSLLEILRGVDKCGEFNINETSIGEIQKKGANIEVMESLNYEK